jgi:polysaccharide deacetylase family protein (PEP-CTERM system associated)
MVPSPKGNELSRDAAQGLAPAMKHAFTVDLEDWYQGIPISSERRAVAERRLRVGTERLLDLLRRHSTRATFFVLSSIAHEHPQLLREMADEGHEIGAHGVSHDLVYEMGPERFREETRRCIRDLEDCIGRPVRSYRAAYFSITNRSLWAFDELAACGIRFDSSVFPVRNWRYGIPGYSRRPAIVSTANGPILEFPMPIRQVLGRTIAATGGAYFRIYPYWLTRANIRAAEAEGLPVAFYIHPWELDPGHPFWRFKARAMVTHYFNLSATVPRLDRMLGEFRFAPLSEVLSETFPDLGARVS